MNRRVPSGFTLIEVIVAIVLSAIAMAAILPMLDRVFQLSHEPRTTLQDGLDLQSAMDGLVVWDAAHSNAPALLQEHIGAVGGLFQDMVVVNNGFVTFPGTGGNESAAANQLLLKVTLQNSLGETATRLFGPPP